MLRTLGKVSTPRALCSVTVMRASYVTRLPREVVSYVSIYLSSVRLLRMHNINKNRIRSSKLTFIYGRAFLVTVTGLLYSNETNMKNARTLKINW